MCEAEQDALWECSLNLLVLGCRRNNVDFDVVTAVFNVFIVADDDVEED